MRHVLLPLFLVGLFSVVPPPLVQAQADRYPCDQVSSQAPNRGQMEEFADRQIERLSDPAQRSDASASLLSPFVDCQNASVQFRLSYGDVLGSARRLAALIEGDDAHVATIAAYIAGQCATSPTNDVLKAGLTSDEPEVRAASAVGARRALQHFKGGRAAFPTPQANDLAAALSAALGQEADPVVAQRLLAALAVAANSPESPALAGPATQAMSLALARWTKAQRPELGQRKAGEPDEAMTVAAGVEALNQAFLQPNVIEAIGDQAWRDVAGGLGQVVAYARDRLIARDALDQRTREALIDALNRSATLIYTIETELRGRSGARQAPALGDIFEKDLSGEQPGAFGAAADAWIGQSGHFTQAPYAIAYREFEPMVEPPAETPEGEGEGDEAGA